MIDFLQVQILSRLSNLFAVQVFMRPQTKGKMRLSTL